MISRIATCRSHLIPEYIEGEVPGQDGGAVLTNSFKEIGDEAQHADYGKDHDNDVRELGTSTIPKAEGDPFGTCHDVGSTHPRGQIHKDKYLVPDRPQPRKPRAFQPINEQDAHRPHGAGDVEHARGIAQSQVVPGELIASEKVRLQVFG